jgi:hypothetical protein
MSPIALTVGIVLLMAVILVVVLIVFRRVAVKREQAARERFPNARMIVAGANFYGQESRGVTQLRGNGTLVLTDDEVYFEQWVTRREFHIPLTAIQAIETPTSHLGKTNFRPLLKIVFKDKAGNTDSMAWLVPDVVGLKNALEQERRE